MRPLFWPAPILLLLAGATTGRASEDLGPAKAGGHGSVQDMAAARDPYWLRLLHYRRDVLGRFRSEIDDPSFFLSRTGRTDPQAELAATLAAFAEPAVDEDDEKQHPQCRYPARYDWLAQAAPNALAPIPPQPCRRYRAWRDQMQPRSVSLIFASSYMNNPASIYGHTFLRLNRGRDGRPQPLLDYTVNYAAEINTMNGILFAVYGLTGGYRGRFSTAPYYIKVQEYNNLESRDLWEYDLSLSSASIQRLLAHLWELGPSSQAYFFFNKNCSYALMPLLEAADPRLDWGYRFWLRAIPADTLRAVADQAGRVTAVRRRPSHVSRMLSKRMKLSHEEVLLAEGWASRPDRAALNGVWTSLPSARQAAVLDAAHALWRLRAGFRRDLAEAEKRKESLLLAERNRLPLRDAPPPVYDAAGTPPHRGHRSSRLRLGFGASSRGPFEEIGLRPAMHDLDDDPAGFLPYSQMQMFDVRMRVDNRRSKAFLTRLRLVDLASISPLDRWVRHPSWRVATGIETAPDLDRELDHTLQYNVNGGSGWGIEWRMPFPLLLYGMAKADFGIGSPFRDGYRFGGGGEGGMIVRPLRFWQVRFEGQILYYPLGHPGGVTRLKLVHAFHLAKRWQLRAILERRNAYKEALWSLQYYF